MWYANLFFSISLNREVFLLEINDIFITININANLAFCKPSAIYLSQDLFSIKQFELAWNEVSSVKYFF